MPKKPPKFFRKGQVPFLPLMPGRRPCNVRLSFEEKTRLGLSLVDRIQAAENKAKAVDELLARVRKGMANPELRNTQELDDIATAVINAAHAVGFEVDPKTMRLLRKMKQP